MRTIEPAVIFIVLGLAGCGSGNLRAPGSSSAPRALTIQNPSYDIYSAPGSVNATWAPAAINRNGTIVRPFDRGVMTGRPDYENAEWATGAGGGSSLRPPGTF